jgi:hypothetical protein
MLFVEMRIDHFAVNQSFPAAVCAARILGRCAIMMRRTASRRQRGYPPERFENVNGRSLHGAWRTGSYLIDLTREGCERMHSAWKSGHERVIKKNPK